jgi:hypothetical protein
LLEAQEHVRRGLVLAQLGRPGGGEHEHPCIQDVACQVAESFPRGGIGEVRVVHEDDYRQLVRQVGDHDGEPLEKAQARRLGLGGWAPDGGHAANDRREIVEESAAELGDLFGAEPAQVTLERLRPHPEGDGLA